MDFDFIMMQVLNGINLSMVYILISLGFGIIYGLMGIINLAHGDFFILGAYVVVLLVSSGFSFWVGVFLAPLFVGFLALFIEKTLIRLLYKRPLTTLLATWGLGTLIRQLLKIIFGPQSLSVENPFPGSLNLILLKYPAYRIFLITLTLFILSLVLWLFFYTKFGLKIRATIEDGVIASAFGINTKRLCTLCFVGASALVGLAGAFMSPLIALNPRGGLTFLLTPFFVVVIGGVEHVLGLVAGGLILGLAETFFSSFLSLFLARVLTFIVAIVILSLKTTIMRGKR
jgi:branched-chain amino acid transport system permease protein/urea transport system permease protein